MSIKKKRDGSNVMIRTGSHHYDMNSEQLRTPTSFEPLNVPTNLKEITSEGRDKKPIINEIFRQDSDSIVDGEQAKKKKSNEQKFLKHYKGKGEKHIGPVHVPRQQKQMNQMLRRKKLCRQFQDQAIMYGIDVSRMKPEG